MFALFTVAVSTFVEKVIVIAASTGTPVGAVAVLRIHSPRNYCVNRKGNRFILLATK